MKVIESFEGYKIVENTTDSKFISLALEPSEELETLQNKKLIEKSVVIGIKESKVEILVAGEPATIKLSKKGTLYFLLNGTFVPFKSILYRVLVEKIISKFTVGETITLGREYRKLQTPNGKFWFSDGFIIGNKEWFKGVVKNFQKASLKELNKEFGSLTREPVLGEPNEIYSSPETFVSREEEMKEFLSILLEIRGSGRKLLPEERELLREIESEINFLI